MSKQLNDQRDLAALPKLSYTLSIVFMFFVGAIVGSIMIIVLGGPH